MKKNKKPQVHIIEKIEEVISPEESPKQSESKENISQNNSVLSDLELEKVDNPRQREILLLAKLNMLQEKVKTKKNLINNLKETLESDERVKKAMQDKIYDLKSRIENYRENAMKQGITVKGLELEDLNGEDLLIRGGEEEEEMLKQGDLFDRGNYEYMLASSAIANEHQNRIFMKNHKFCMGKFRHRFHNFLNFFTPFKEDIRHISYRFDREVQVYFEIHRFLFLLSFGIFVCYIYFLINIITNADFSTNANLCKFNIPCFLFYSRIQSTQESAFSITYAIMTFVVVYFSLLKYISYSKLRQDSKLYDRQDTKVSYLFFSSWDWSTNSKGMYLENKKRLRELYKLSITETNIKERKGDKNIKTKKMTNFCLRLLSFMLTIIILAIYFGVIIFAYYLRGNLKSKDTNKVSFSIVDILLEILPPVLIAIANLMFPNIIMRLVYIEKWDFMKTVRNQITIRYFIGKIFGLAAVYFVNIYFILLGKALSGAINLTQLNTHGCPGTAVVNSNDTTNIMTNFTQISKSLYSECAEDDAVINILFIVMAEFVIRKLWELISFSCLHCCYRSKRNRGENYKWPFITGKTSVNVLVFFIQLSALITYFPFITFLIPILLFLEFKFEKFKLINMRSKPLKFDIKTEDGSLLMKLFSFSIFLVIIFNITFYISNIPHNNYIECYNTPSGNQLVLGKQLCGPYPTMTSASTTFLKKINSISILDFIYYVVSNPASLVILLIIVISLFLHRSENIDTYKFYLKETEKDMTKLINKLERKVEDLGQENKNLVVDKLNGRHA